MHLEQIVLMQINAVICCTFSACPKSTAHSTLVFPLQITVVCIYCLNVLGLVAVAVGDGGEPFCQMVVLALITCSYTGVVTEAY